MISEEYAEWAVNDVFVCQHCFSGFPHFVGHTLHQTESQIWKTHGETHGDFSTTGKRSTDGRCSIISVIFIDVNSLEAMNMCLLRPKYPWIEYFFFAQKTLEKSPKNTQILTWLDHILTFPG